MGRDVLPEPRMPTAADPIRPPAVAALIAAALAAPAPAAYAAHAVPPAAPTPGGGLTLPAALARGLADHPGVRAAMLAVDAAKAREVQAAALPNPNLTLTADQVPFAHPIAGNYMAGVTQPLLPGALREAQAGVARVEREMAEAALATERLELATRIKSAFAHVHHAAEAVRLAHDTAEHARWLAKAAATRWKAGDVARVEALRAEVEAAKAGRELRAAEGQAAEARARLSVLLGRDAHAPLALAGLASPRLAVLPPVADLVARALAGRVELRQAELAVRREALQRQAALAGIWTGAELAASVGAVGGQPGATTLLALPIPIYRRQGEAAEAEANRLRAEAARDALRHEVTLEVERARREAVLAADLAAHFARELVPPAAKLAANARERYRAGEGNGVEVAEAEHALHEARGGHAQAVLDWHEAIARLERAVGAEAAELEVAR